MLGAWPAIILRELPSIRSEIGTIRDLCEEMRNDRLRPAKLASHDDAALPGRLLRFLFLLFVASLAGFLTRLFWLPLIQQHNSAPAVACDIGPGVQVRRCLD